MSSELAIIKHQLMQLEILLQKVLEKQTKDATYLLSEKFNSDDAADMIGISKRHLMKLKELNKIGFFQDGKKLFFGRNHIEEYLKSIEYRANP